VQLTKARNGPDGRESCSFIRSTPVDLFPLCVITLLTDEINIINPHQFMPSQTRKAGGVGGGGKPPHWWLPSGDARKCRRCPKKNSASTDDCHDRST
jgi:hypothetical protein